MQRVSELPAKSFTSCTPTLSENISICGLRFYQQQTQKLSHVYKILYGIITGEKEKEKKRNRKQLLTWGLPSPPCLAVFEELLHRRAPSALSYSHGQILLTYIPPCK